MRERPKCLPRGFETTDIAERRRDRLIKVLQRNPERFATQIDLLYECNVRSGCGARICDICMRKARVILVREGRTQFESLGRSGQLIGYSIILGEETGDVDRGPPDFARLCSRLRRRLQRLPLPVPKLIAGLDVSLNERCGQSHWQLQLYGVTHAANEKALRKAFGVSGSIERPIRIRLCTDLPRALTYSLKTRIVRRVSYVDQKTGHWTTKKFDLRPSQQRTLAWWLRNAGCWDTMFFRGLTRRGDHLVSLRKA
jgi:hypothetical protein